MWFHVSFMFIKDVGPNIGHNELWCLAGLNLGTTLSADVLMGLYYITAILLMRFYPKLWWFLILFYLFDVVAVLTDVFRANRLIGFMLRELSWLFLWPPEWHSLNASDYAWLVSPVERAYMHLQEICSLLQCLLSYTKAGNGERLSKRKLRILLGVGLI